MEENIQGQCAFIKHVCVFGTGKPVTAAIVEIDWDALTPQCSLPSVCTAVFKAVEISNVLAPSHSRLSQQYVHLLPAGQSLPLNSKGSVHRKLAMSHFDDVLTDMYETPTPTQKNVLDTTSQCTSAFGNEPLMDMRTALIHRLSGVMDIDPLILDLESHQSLFRLGANSQVAVEIHHVLEELCRAVLPSSFLFEYSSVDDLVSAMEQAQYGVNGRLSLDAVSRIRTPHTVAQNLAFHFHRRIQDLADLLRGFREVQKPPEAGSDRVVLLTGASGALGAHLTETLLAHGGSIKKVICLMRGPDPRSRLEAVARQRQLNNLLTCCCDPQSTRLQFHEWSMTSDLGLSSLEGIPYEALKEATDIILNAWKLDFNLGVMEFEHDCLESVFDFVKLAASSINLQRLHLVSSISSIAGWQIPPPSFGEQRLAVRRSVGYLEEIREEGQDKTEIQTAEHLPEDFLGPDQVRAALPIGYGQSKFLAELIMAEARHQLGVPTCIYRCGQLSGDWKTGSWNPKDFVAMMSTEAAGILGKVPQLVYAGDFVPLDIAANAIVEIMMSLDETQFGDALTDVPVFNIANPCGGDWMTWLNALRQAGLEFEVVSSSAFLALLDNHPESQLSLLRPFISKIARASQMLTAIPMCVERAVSHSPCLASCPPVNSDMAMKYVNYWRSIKAM
eukprot:Blabericola_migrator_1__13572@NODE_997_length_5748_cov_347_101567_g686_i0_p2_GENE_NODE_997_length_5748_cov_347_101567_g686_i0NODE_997_length_5748_cov_347_101567_g686_i0_p2_ORF_typecomplete_len673_score135_08NAD_binding_4/PF07993_12/4_3e40Epimerase/PF01370_21/6_8e03Epimerase/PF01370_21/6e03Epimerase/PF01370_21/1_7e12GDP_Man_Dehyd/PF16363_5/0_32GDP_Man_Dehyd/PF16363_5/0_0049PPbinding/PF00550_25/0_00053PPbinding/PF00550_25/1_8e033Beta_HSD/PF01073_19/0_0038KR/PF08659_10/14KR/PF08659_10/0_029KR/PF086